jgi:5-methylcytosine-specific restriction endonuclease McrA
VRISDTIIKGVPKRDYQREYMRQWRAKNLAKKREYERVYAAKRYKENEQRRIYTDEYTRQWRRENRERHLETERLWRLDNPEKLRVQKQIRRGRIGQTLFTADDLRWVRVMQGDRCVYCKIPLVGKGELDHILPLARKGSNDLYNLQFLCGSCNARKHVMTDQEFRSYRSTHV